MLVIIMSETAVAVMLGGIGETGQLSETAMALIEDMDLPRFEGKSVSDAREEQKLFFCCCWFYAQARLRCREPGAGWI